MKLSPKQRAFCDYYIETGNAEESAVRAGYSKAYARGNAHKLVANSCNKKYIEQRMKELESKRIADAEEVLQYLTSVLRAETTQQVPITYKDGFEITDIEPSVKDRVRAAELLGKRYALFTDKVEQTGDINIVVSISDDDE